MSDDDRLADYLRRIEGDPTPRTLEDGCTSCNHSAVYCRCCRYRDLGPCCGECTHTSERMNNTPAHTSDRMEP